LLSPGRSSGTRRQIAPHWRYRPSLRKPPRANPAHAKSPESMSWRGELRRARSADGPASAPPRHRRDTHILAQICDVLLNVSLGRNSVYGRYRTSKALGATGGFWLNLQTSFRKSVRQGAGENRSDFKGCGIEHRTPTLRGKKIHRRKPPVDCCFRLTCGRLTPSWPPSPLLP
jgi:hypothetical protein